MMENCAHSEFYCVHEKSYYVLHPQLIEGALRTILGLQKASTVKSSIFLLKLYVDNKELYIRYIELIILY